MRMLKTLILVLFIASPVYAQGVVMVMSETSGGQTTQSRMHLDQTHVRAEYARCANGRLNRSNSYQ